MLSCYIYLHSHICFVADPTRDTQASTEAPTEVPPTAVPTVRRTRGPTRFSVETTRRPGDPRMRVELTNGKAVGKNKSKFKTTVLGWIHQPSVLPQDVPNYGAIPDAMKEALFRRVVVS
jgi:hypothetical protein